MSLSPHLFMLRLDQQRYALPLPAVVRVLRMVEITPVPTPRPAVLGLINVQGEVIQVIDLRSCLHHPLREVEPGDVLVIATAGEGKVALAADSVGGVLEAGGQLVLWEREEQRQSRFLDGVVKLADGMVMVCNLEQIASLCGGEPPGPDEAPAEGVHPAQSGAAELAGAPHGEGTLPEKAASAASTNAALLAQRARKLAREPEAEEGGERLEIVEFQLSSERYAVESAFIREVYPLKELTPLPCTPPFVLGIVNLRGKILSVIDLRTFFELPEKGLSDLNKVIVLESAGMEFGVLADLIVGVRSVEARQLQRSLPTPGLRGDYLKGVTAERLVVLDAAKILADGRIVVHEEA